MSEIRQAASPRWGMGESSARLHDEPAVRSTYPRAVRRRAIVCSAMPTPSRALRALAFVAIACATSVAAAQQTASRLPDTLVVPIASNAHWWAGVIAQGDVMPLHDGYDADIAARNYGNQIQPLLL